MSHVLCWICYKIASMLKGIIRHMDAVHAYDPHFSVCCGVDGCSRTYTNFYSFKKLLYRRHRARLDAAVPNSRAATLNEDSISCGDYPVSLGEKEVPRRLSKFEHINQMALFLLKTEEIRKVSQVALDDFVADFTSLLQRRVEQLQHQVKGCLAAKELYIEGLDNVFQEEAFTNPLNQLNSNFLQETFYQEHLHLLV